MEVSAVVSLTSLALWISIAVHVSNNGMLALYSTIVQCSKHMCLEKSVLLLYRVCGGRVL